LKEKSIKPLSKIIVIAKRVMLHQSNLQLIYHDQQLEVQQIFKMKTTLRGLFQKFLASLGNFK